MPDICSRHGVTRIASGFCPQCHPAEALDWALQQVDALQTRIHHLEECANGLLSEDGRSFFTDGIGEWTLPELFTQADHVTRVEVIDHAKGGTGRVYSRRPCRVTLSYQDGGTTLKVFVDDPQ